MNQMLKEIIRRLLTVIVWCLYYAVRMLPLRIASLLGAAAGTAVFYLPLPVRATAIKNLTRAFPDKKAGYLRKIARASFKNQGRNLFELLTFSGINRSMIDQIVSFDGKENLEKAFRNNKGVFCLGAHFGNWELMGAALSLWGFPINVIARKIYITRINDLLVRLRNAVGIKVILRSGKSAAKDMLKSLRNNELIGILIDQDAHVPGVWIDFFSTPAYTPTGLAVLALKSGAPVISGFMVRKNGTHCLEIRGPLSLIRTDNFERDIRENTKMFTGIIEDYVRRYPEQWVWMHDRWKHRQPNEVL